MNANNANSLVSYKLIGFIPGRLFIARMWMFRLYHQIQSFKCFRYP